MATPLDSLYSDQDADYHATEHYRARARELGDGATPIPLDIPLSRWSIVHTLRRAITSELGMFHPDEKR